MRKIISLTLALVILLSFASCGGGGAQPPANNEALLKFAEENEDALLASVKSGFEDTVGASCEATLEVVGNGFVVNINIDGFNNISDEEKKAIQETYDTMGPVFDEFFKGFKQELPELEYFTINVCEEDGDILATINMK